MKSGLTRHVRTRQQELEQSQWRVELPQLFPKDVTTRVCADLPRVIHSILMRHPVQVYCDNLHILRGAIELAMQTKSGMGTCYPKSRHCLQCNDIVEETGMFTLQQPITSRTSYEIAYMQNCNRKCAETRQRSTRAFLVGGDPVPAAGRLSLRTRIKIMHLHYAAHACVTQGARMPNGIPNGRFMSDRCARQSLQHKVRPNVVSAHRTASQLRMQRW